MGCRPLQVAPSLSPGLLLRLQLRERPGPRSVSKRWTKTRGTVVRCSLYEVYGVRWLRSVRTRIVDVDSSRFVA